MAVLGRLKAVIRPSRWPALVAGLPTFRRLWLLQRLRFFAWRAHATVEADLPPGVRVGRRVSIEVGDWTHTTISIRPGSRLGDGVILRLRGGSLELGPTVDVRSNVVLNMGGGRLVLDGSNNLGWGVVIHCGESIHLARFAHVAEYATIVDSAHFYTAPDEWSYHNTRTAPIDLGEDVWVCPKATITSGVTIGDHTIVASNSVVVRDTPGGVLVSGVPAKVIRELDLPWPRPSDAAP